MNFHDVQRDDSGTEAFDRVIARHLPTRAARSARLGAPGESREAGELNVAVRLLRSNDDPGRPAILEPCRSVSYGELRTRVLTLAHGLRLAGVRPADRVAVSLPNGADFAAVWLAVQWIGAIGVQLPTAYRRREIARVLADSGARLVVSVRAAEFDGAPSGARVTSVRELGANIDARNDEEPYAYRVEDPAALSYVATADGPLVGAVHSAGDLLASCDAYSRDVLQLSATDVCIGAIGWSWPYGLGALLMFPLHAGAATALVESPMDLLAAVATRRATVLFGVATTYRMLLRHPALGSADLGSLRLCVSAGEALPADVVREWRSRTQLDILDGFGTTELTHICISARPGAVRPGVIGTTVPGYRAKIVDDTFRDVGDGVPGLLAVMGPTGATYWNNEALQRRRVCGGWTLTGDLCVRHADGSFEHVRRADTIIVSAGHKISIPEVEAVLTSHPEVGSAQVFAVPDAVRGSAAQATVAAAAHADSTTLAERLKAYVKQELAPFKCPRAITIV